MRFKALARDVTLAIAGAAVLSGTPAMARAAESREALLEEVIVTARKRDERLQDVPMSVTALSASALEVAGITNVESLPGRIPALNFSQNNNVSPQKESKAIVLRGVGFNPVLEPSTGLFIDGVYQPGIGFDVGFLDVQRIEILRGPQGTLFGRNTEAGAINIVSRRPGDELQARVSMEVDNLMSVRTQASADGPIAPGGWYGGIAVQAGHSDGYYDNKTKNDPQDDAETTAGRFSLRYDAGGALEAFLAVDGAVKRGNAVGVGVNDALDEDYDVFDDTVGDNDQENYGASLILDYDFGGVLFTSLTGFRSSSSEQLADIDGGADYTGNFQTIAVDNTSASQEFRLASNGDDSLQWLAGVYVFSDEYDQRTQSGFDNLAGTPLAILAGGSSDADMAQSRDGVAVFGQATYSISERLDITAGLRWSDEDVDVTRRNFLDIPIFSQIGIPNPTVITGDDASESFDNVSGTATISYDWTPDVMTYLTVATGYKAGGFEKFPSTRSVIAPIDEETTVNYEAGIKSTLLDGRMVLNVSVFHTDIEDMQLFTLVTDPVTGLPRSSIGSAGESESEGVEFEMLIMPVEGLTLSANAAYTDTSFDEFTDADGNDRSGDSFPYVPEWSGYLGIDYVRPIGNGLDFRFTGSYRYIDDLHAGIGTRQDPRFELESYEIVDLEIGIGTDVWNAALFLRNALDEYAIVNMFPGLLAGDSYRTVLPPQTVGARVNFQW